MKQDAFHEERIFLNKRLAS